MAESPHWIVDGMNVIGSRPTGWWRDRAGAMRALAERLAAFAAASGEPITLVLDSRPLDGMPEADGLEIVFATPRRGVDAADEEIARIVQQSEVPAELRVVTADRELVARVQEAGADVVGPRAFL